jgi:hypothetical protein
MNFGAARSADGVELSSLPQRRSRPDRLTSIDLIRLASMVTLTTAPGVVWLTLAVSQCLRE